MPWGAAQVANNVAPGGGARGAETHSCSTRAGRAGAEALDVHSGPAILVVPSPRPRHPVEVPIQALGVVILGCFVCLGECRP